jgi:hypothetical protein
MEVVAGGEVGRAVRREWGKAQNRYTKKPRQAFVSSSLDSLGLSVAVEHCFVCEKLFDGLVGRIGVCTV